MSDATVLEVSVYNVFVRTTERKLRRSHSQFASHVRIIQADNAPNDRKSVYVILQ